MYYEPIFLTPIFKERIWGGTQLKDVFNFPIPSEQTGEAWIISALPNDANEVKNGPLAGKTLDELWKHHGELFARNEKSPKEYPLLVKFIDANDDLSVQVHPDDEYAQTVEKVPYGKTECWYIVDAAPDAEIVFGHHATTKDELHKLIDQGKWEELLHREKVQKGDFFFVPSGMIHAIGEGIMVLEIQQSSDITYRVYDYDRTDDEGNKRDLHLNQAKDVITVPGIVQTEQDFATTEEKDLTIQTLIETEYFTVFQWNLQGEVTRKVSEDFLQVVVVNGDASIQTGDKAFSLTKGDSFIIPKTVPSYTLTGNAELIVSHL